MTNEEAIRILEDITWNSNRRYEVTDMLDTRNLSIQALQENTKLKAEIEQLKENYDTLAKQYSNVENSSIRYYNELKQLKSELEQYQEPARFTDLSFEQALKGQV